MTKKLLRLVCFIAAHLFPLVRLILPIIYGGLGWILAIFSRAVSTGISRSSDAIPSYLTLSYPILQCKKLFLDISKMSQCKFATTLSNFDHSFCIVVQSTCFNACKFVCSLFLSKCEKNNFVIKIWNISTKNGSIALPCWQDMLRHSRDVLIHLQCPFEACMKAIEQEAQNRHPK